MVIIKKLIKTATQLGIIALYTVIGLLLSGIHFSIGHFFLPIIAPYFLSWTVIGVVTGVIIANFAFKGE